MIVWLPREADAPYRRGNFRESQTVEGERERKSDSDRARKTERKGKKEIERKGEGDRVRRETETERVTATESERKRERDKEQAREKGKEGDREKGREGGGRQSKRETEIKRETESERENPNYGSAHCIFYYIYIEGPNLFGPFGLSRPKWQQQRYIDMHTLLFFLSCK